MKTHVEVSRSAFLNFKMNKYKERKWEMLRFMYNDFTGKKELEHILQGKLVMLKRV